MDIFTEILQVIKKIRRRLNLNLVLLYGLYGGVAGVSLGALLNFWAIWFPVPDAVRLGILLGILGVAAGVCLGIYKRVSLEQAALTGDKRGLHESLITALWLREKNDPFARAQREQTKTLLTSFSLSEQIPVKVPMTTLFLFACALICLVVCMLVPSPAKEAAAAQKELQALIKEQIEEIEERKEEIAKLDDMDPDLQAAMLALLNQTMEELQSMEDKEELDKIMERLAMKMQMAEVQSTEEQQKKMEEEVLKALEQELKDYLDNQGIEITNEELSKAMEELSSQLSQADSSGEGLENLAQQLSMSEADLQEMLNNAQQSLQAGGSGQENLQANQGNEGQNGNGEGNTSQGESGQGDGGQGEGGQGDGGQGEGGQGEGGSQGSGQGTGGSQGGQNGSGTGSGYDTGSKNGFEKASAGTANQEGLNIPKRDVGEDDNLTGQRTGDSSYFIETQTGLAWNGEIVDYRQVTGEYTESAYKKIENQRIPDAVKGVVKDYFAGLAQ